MTRLKNNPSLCIHATTVQEPGVITVTARDSQGCLFFLVWPLKVHRDVSWARWGMSAVAAATAAAPPAGAPFKTSIVSLFLTKITI